MCFRSINSGVIGVARRRSDDPSVFNSSGSDLESDAQTAVWRLVRAAIRRWLVHTTGTRRACWTAARRDHLDVQGTAPSLRSGPAKRAAPPSGHWRPSMTKALIKKTRWS